MTEQEYIDATNLAKLRTALTIIRDCLPMTGKEEGVYRKIRIPLQAEIERLEAIVRTS